MSPILHGIQSHDQHAFTPLIRIEDALLCAESVIEYSLEFHMPIWLLSLDLRKAFDTINHDRLFEALESCGVELPYISLLKLLYVGQSVSVHEGREFDILRGVKQGDVLSAILFNCVLDLVFRNWKRRLSTEGILVDSSIDRLTNTRYTNEILVHRKSLE